MRTITIVFHEGPQTFPMLSWEAHTYGFLEVIQLDGTSKFYNLREISCFEPSASVMNAPIPAA